jgi:hypothetical protein
MWAFSIIGPIRTAGSRGSPTRHSFRIAAILDTTSS